MKDNRLKIGIVGLGMGKSHAVTCAQLQDVNLKAISDLNLDRLETTASELNVPEKYQDGFELIDNADLDAVVIALPNHLHAKFSIKAMQSGKHVLVEKPIAVDVNEAKDMIRVSKETGKLLMVGFSQRFFPPHLAAWHYIKQGNIGKIHYAKTSWLRRKGIPWWFEACGKGSLTTNIAGGGPLIDIGVHRLDLALFMMGFPEVVSVNGTTFCELGKEQGKKIGIDYALEDAGVALIRFRDNRALFLESSWTMHCKDNEKQETFLYGDKGGMHLANEVEVYSERDGIQTETRLLNYENAPAGGVTEHFCRVVQQKEESIITGDQALSSLRILKAIYESAETGKTIYFD